MSLYNRLRIVDLASRQYERDVEAVKVAFRHRYEPLGARYAGYGVFNRLGLCHQWMVEDVSDASLARVLELAKITPLRLYREQPQVLNPTLFSIDAIMEQVARALAPRIARDLGFEACGEDCALAWQGVRVLADMARS